MAISAFSGRCVVHCLGNQEPVTTMTNGLTPNDERLALTDDKVAEASDGFVESLLPGEKPRRWHHATMAIEVGISSTSIHVAHVNRRPPTSIVSFKLILLNGKTPECSRRPCLYYQDQNFLLQNLNK